MLINFYKYHGAGNDFILIDNRKENLNLSQELVQTMCKRHTGIGSDGLMLLENSDKFDFKMQFFNPDGSKGMMCGNGGRCIVRFTSDLGIIKNKTQFEAPDGLHWAEIKGETVYLGMNNIENLELKGDDFIIDSGAPHYIKFTDDIDKLDVKFEGQKIRYSAEYAEAGINVNFVQLENNHIKIRTYERGVEDETLACGTGIVAAAIASSQKYFDNKSEILVKALGGNLNVRFKIEKNRFINVELSGPAKFVYKGVFVQL